MQVLVFEDLLLLYVSKLELLPLKHVLLMLQLVYVKMVARSRHRWLRKRHPNWDVIVSLARHLVWDVEVAVVYGASTAHFHE